MGDKSIIQVIERLSEALSPHIVPILKQDILDLTPQPWGTGFLVQAANHYFLISAAHVLDGPNGTCKLFCFLDNPPRYSWLRQRPSRLTEPPPGKTRRDDRIDVGVCYLGSMSSLPGVEHIALPLDRLRPAALPREDKWYMLAGFPAGSNQVGTDRRAKMITSERATKVAQSRPIKVYQRCGVTPETHIVIDHARDLKPGASNRHGKFPKTGGMSGSPLWLLPGEGEKKSDLKPPPIVGVFIQYDGPRRALISTDIGEALKKLHELRAILGQR